MASVETGQMYAMIGELIFEPLSGFTSYSESDEGEIAQYGLLVGKPYPQATAPKLRELSIGVRLHQRFIKVQQARLQLRAYKDNGTVVTLSWGNGNIEGRFLIQNISTTVEEGDKFGNVYCVSCTLSLLEVPEANLLDVKQADSYKEAFGLSDYAQGYVYIPPPPPTPLQLFKQQLAKAMRYAAMIDALAYGGRFPYLGSSMGQIIGNASANSVLMGQNFADNGAAWDIVDVSSDITNVTTSLTTLAGFDPVSDPVGFGAANKVYQDFNRVLCF